MFGFCTYSFHSACSGISDELVSRYPVYHPLYTRGVDLCEFSQSFGVSLSLVYVCLLSDMHRSSLEDDL